MQKEKDRKRFSSLDEALERIEALQAEENKLLHDMDSTRKNIARLEPWGEFSMQQVRRIESATGLRVHFFRCSSKFFRQEWADNYFAIPVNEFAVGIHNVSSMRNAGDVGSHAL